MTFTLPQHGHWMLHDEDLSYQLCQSHSHLPGKESEILQNALYNFYNHLPLWVLCVSVYMYHAKGI